MITFSLNWTDLEYRNVIVHERNNKSKYIGKKHIFHKWSSCLELDINNLLDCRLIKEIFCVNICVYQNRQKQMRALNFFIRRKHQKIFRESWLFLKSLKYQIQFYFSLDWQKVKISIHNLNFFHSLSTFIINILIFFNQLDYLVLIKL